MAALIYIADPMCSWCYGFGQELQALLEDLPDLSLEIVLGGLRTRDDLVMNDAMKRELMTHSKHVHEASGLPFSDGAVAQPGFIYNTEPACRAVVTARSLSPATSLPVFHAIQQAFYREGRDTTCADVLAEVACTAMTGSGSWPDPMAFLAMWSSEKLIAATQADFHRTKSWKIGGFPTLLLQRDGQLDIVSAGYQRMPALRDRLLMLMDHGAPA